MTFALYPYLLSLAIAQGFLDGLNHAGRRGEVIAFPGRRA